MIVLLATSGVTPAQEDAMDSLGEWMHPDRIDNLEHVRRLNEFGVYGAGMDGGMGMNGGMGMDGGMGMEMGMQHEPSLIQQIDKMRQEARREIETIRNKLADPKNDRPKLEERLKDALKDYFVLDMRYRVMELDEIKEKLADTEAKLLKRLEAKDEAVDLQLQVMLREAEGLGFFPKDKTSSGLDSGSFDRSR